MNEYLLLANHKPYLKFTPVFEQLNRAVDENKTKTNKQTKKPTQTKPQNYADQFPFKSMS